jgi:hypothetical protein
MCRHFGKKSIEEKDKKTLLVEEVSREKKQLKRSPIWDKEKIINRIKEIKARNEPLNPGYLLKNYRPLYCAISRYFGEGSFKEGHEKALSAAGLKPERKRPIFTYWNKEMIISRIKEIKSRNELIYPLYLRKNYSGLYYAIREHFGGGSFKEGYKKVLLAAKITPKEVRSFPIWNKEKIISQIKEIKSGNEPLYPQYLFKNYGGLYYAIGRYFGEGSFKEGYKKALAAAKLKPEWKRPVIIHWDREKIVSQIKEIKAHNESLHPGYLRRNHYSLYLAIKRHFGRGSFKEGYKKALAAAKIKPEWKYPDRINWDKEEIINQLKEIKARNEPLYLRYLYKNYPRLYNAIYRYFSKK